MTSQKKNNKIFVLCHKSTKMEVKHYSQKDYGTVKHNVEIFYIFSTYRYANQIFFKSKLKIHF